MIDKLLPSQVSVELLNIPSNSETKSETEVSARASSVAVPLLTRDNSELATTEMKVKAKRFRQFSKEEIQKIFEIDVNFEQSKRAIFYSLDALKFPIFRTIIKEDPSNAFIRYLKIFTQLFITITPEYIAELREMSSIQEYSLVKESDWEPIFNHYLEKFYVNYPSLKDARYQEAIQLIALIVVLKTYIDDPFTFKDLNQLIILKNKNGLKPNLKQMEGIFLQGINWEVISLKRECEMYPPIEIKQKKIDYTYLATNRSNLKHSISHFCVNLFGSIFGVRGG